MKNNTSKYSMMKKIGIGAAVLASSYLPMTAKAQDNSATPAQFPEYDMSTLLAAQPTEMQKVNAKAKENIEARTEKGEYKNLFTSNNGTEFLWGLSRPLHLWNTDPQNGNTLVYPYLINGRKTAFTGAFEAGGILSPLEGLVASLVNGTGYLCGAKDSLMYNAFADNWALTLGVVPHYALIALAGGSGGGSSSTPADTGGDKGTKPKPKPKPKPNEPITPPYGGGQGGDL